MGGHAAVDVATTRRAARHARSAPPRRRAPRVAWVIFGVVLAATLLRGTGTPFEYDAHYYWDAATTLVTGGGTPQADPKFYDLRGVLTAATFAPAAAVAAVGGEHLAGIAVLLQNALVIAGVGAFLIPALARPWRPLGTAGRWLAGAATWAVLQGFAPFPMADLYAVTAVLTALVLLAQRRPAALLVAGGALGYAINVRPAYLPAVALIAVVVLATHRARALWAVPGFLLSLMPQFVYTLAVAGRPSFAPPGGDRLVALQAGYASYVVRYDTFVWRDLQPRQFFCSPTMAERVDGALPETTGQLILTFVRELPASAVFALEKIAASLHWPWAIPYASDDVGVNALFAAAVTAVTVIGCAHLVAVPIVRRGTPKGDLIPAAARVLALGVGAIVMLVGSATETRFALPLALLGVTGVAAFVDEGSGSVRRRRFLVGAVLAAAVVVAIGYAGMAHPAPMGGTNPTTCSAT